MDACGIYSSPDWYSPGSYIVLEKDFGVQSLFKHFYYKYYNNVHNACFLYSTSKQKWQHAYKIANVFKTIW